MVWLSFLVRIYTAAREVKRENDGGEGEGEGEKNCLHCLHWLLSSSPIARFRAMRRKRPLELSSPIALGTRVTSHNSPKWGACSRVTCYGEVLRKKQNKIFNFQWILEGSLFFTTPLPQSETKNPFRVTWKRLEKVITTWNACLRNNKNFNYQQILPLLFLHVVASFWDFSQ